MAEVVRTAARLAHQQRECTPGGEVVPPPTDARVALLVGGLGSTSDAAGVDGVDTAALGYRADDVVRFSYRGGLVPDPTDGLAFATLARSAYDATSSAGDLQTVAQRLADVLTQLARARPGVPIDVIAHSQGGIVARLAVASAAAGGTLPPEVATLATIGTPHGGADLATAAVASGRTPGVLHLAGSVTSFPPDAPAVQQLSETSELIGEIRDLPLPDRVVRRSIAARGDLVVPVPRTVDRAFPSAVVPSSGVDAHDRLPASPLTTRELALTLAGRPPTCVSPWDRWVDAAVGEAIAWATDAAGAAALAG
jgi:pimeloyl-ACP methyl ester carboxylesterase